MTALRPSRADNAPWIPVCAYADLHAERGAAALVGERQIALFRTFCGDVHAIDNEDPFTGAFVLSRGIVGTRGEVPTVSSPLHKQAFDLITGQCLDDPMTCVRTYPVRTRDGVVEVAIG